MTAHNIPGYDERADELLTLCWCGAEFRWVPRADVLAGRTASCKAVECVEGVTPNMTAVVEIRKRIRELGR